MILVSACLCGIACRHNGESAVNGEVVALVREGLALPVCPEQLGGLPTPRPAAEIIGWDGADVLRGSGKVVTAAGEDLTAAFVRGAEEVVRMAKLVGATKVILKDRSPSCGCGTIYNGNFTGTLRPGVGVCAAALRAAGIAVEPK